MKKQNEIYQNIKLSKKKKQKDRYNFITKVLLN